MTDGTQNQGNQNQGAGDQGNQGNQNQGNQGNQNQNNQNQNQGAGDQNQNQNQNQGAGGTNQTTPWFADDWRDKFAESVKPGDTKFRERLNRFASPADVGKSWLSIEQRQSSGELKPVLPKDATEEQIAAFRKESGLPEKADAYVAALQLPNGMVLGEADKPLIADLAEKVAHKGLWSPQQFNDAVAWYYGMQDALAVKTEDADAAHKQTTDDGLRTEWGGDYRPNIQAVENMLARMPDGLAESMLVARVPAPTKDDPTRTIPLGNHPDFIKWAARTEREINPTATLLPAGSGDVGKSVNDEIAAIEKTMRTDRRAYDLDHKMQARYRELLDARTRLNSRAA